MIIDRKNFKREEKKLKKYEYEFGIFEKVLEHMKIVKTFKELKNHPISFLYGFEKLKGDLKGFYSFNLCKNGGMIRLLFSVDEDNNIIFLEYISMKHYEDFKINRR